MSASTIDSHLSNVYEKLEVVKKSTLYTCFFREWMLPEFEGDPVDR